MHFDKQNIDDVDQNNTLRSFKSNDHNNCSTVIICHHIKLMRVLKVPSINSSINYGRL